MIENILKGLIVVFAAWGVVEAPQLTNDLEKIILSWLIIAAVAFSLLALCEHVIRKIGNK